MDGAVHPLCSPCEKLPNYVLCRKPSENGCVWTQKYGELLLTSELATHSTLICIESFEQPLSLAKCHNLCHLQCNSKDTKTLGEMPYQALANSKLHSPHGTYGDAGPLLHVGGPLLQVVLLVVQPHLQVGFRGGYSGHGEFQVQVHAPREAAEVQVTHFVPVGEGEF